MAKFESKYDVGQDVILGGITGIITEIHLSLKGYSYNVKRENSVVYHVEESDSNLEPAPERLFAIACDVLSGGFYHKTCLMISDSITNSDLVEFRKNASNTTRNIKKYKLIEIEE